MLVGSSSHVVLEDLDVVWNSWAGVAVARSQGITLRGVRADHNGVAGMTGSKTDDLLVVDSQTSYNNWRGIRGAEDVEQGRSSVDRTFVDYAAGQKFLYLRRATFRRFSAVGNLSAGLWFDYDNRDIRIQDSVLSDNLTWGCSSRRPPGRCR